MGSILDSTKKSLGVGEDYDVFDPDIIMHINTVFAILNQLGVGPAETFQIEDETTTWGEFTQNNKTLNMVKSYVYLRVRLLFDPPETSYLINALDEQRKEMEFRMTVHSEGERWVLH